ncbi:hypothetical protein INR49_021601, partial [Caranx melampygus]
SRPKIDEMIDALSTVYLVFLTPSVIGSFSVLVVSIVKWRHLQQQVHLLVQLALADLLAALILMFTSVMNITETSNSVVICLYILPLSLTFYFVSFLLVVVYAWRSKNGLRGWRAEDEGGQSQCRRKIVAIPVYALVWLIPIAMYLAYILTPFIKPAVLYFVLACLEGLLLKPSLILSLMSTLMILTNIEQHRLFGLYMIQAASVSLQGFLNSMVYAWRRPNFTEAVLGENTPLVAHNSLAFFDESLRSSS